MNNQSNLGAGKFAFAFLAFFICLAVAAVTSYSQTPQPTATPEKEDVIRVNTNLIQTNVAVFDKSGRFVEGLKPEQFALKIDGKPAKIEFFDDKSAYLSIERAQQNENPQKKPIAGEADSLRSRKVVFFVDDLHLSLDSLGRTRSTINHFIENDMRPNDEVLIVSSSGQIGFLQQFTDNPAVIRAAVSRLKVIPNLSRDTEQPPMPEYIAIRILGGDRDAAEYYIMKILEGFSTKNAPMNKNAAREMVKQRANNIVGGLAAVTDSTLTSLEGVMENLSRTSGQKTVFLISDGFYLDSKNSNFASNTKFQRVVDQATRSGSVIYTIDARGLFSLMADATGAERPVDSSGMLKSKPGEETASQEGLFVLADETGGRFLKNQNFFEKWVDRMLDENSSYYVIAWQPEKEDDASRNFKKIDVSVVGQPDLIVRFQRGYLTNSEKGNDKTVAGGKKTPDKITPENKTFNSSNSADSKVPKKFLATNLSLNYLDVPNVGGVLTSSVQVATRTLDYGTDGKQSASVDVVGLIYNEQGKQIADFKTGLNISPSNAANGGSSDEQSVIYNHRTPLAAGIYMVKVAARAAKTGQVGIATKWIEIPDLSKRQLTLGSLLLGAKTVSGSGGGGAGNAVQQQQVQFSVDHRFTPRPFNMSFMSFIYNAAQKSGEGGVNLTSQIEVFDAAGRAIISSPVRPLVLKGNSDSARIPLTGAIRQNLFAPGTYLLRVTVKDLTANTSAVQQTVFTVD